MIIFKFKEQPETRGNKWPCKAFRWIFEINFKDGFDIGFVHQHQLKESGKWYSSHTDVYLFFIDCRLRFGNDHFYYDGPHCIYSFGPFSIQFSNWNCKKCLDK